MAEPPDISDPIVIRGYIATALQKGITIVPDEYKSTVIETYVTDLAINASNLVEESRSASKLLEDNKEDFIAIAHEHLKIPEEKWKPLSDLLLAHDKAELDYTRADPNIHMATYDPDLIGSEINGIQINDGGDLSIAIANQKGGVSTLNGTLLGYGDKLCTRLSFTASMDEILTAADAHRKALNQGVRKASPLKPETKLAAGKAKVLEDQAVSKGSNIQMQ